MSDHSKLLASRVKTPVPNKWCYDFAASKKYAVENGLPFIALWTNGDRCGHCVRLASSLNTKTFSKWMNTSGCIFWLGAGEDKWADNKQNSAGYMWASRNIEITTFPFIRIYWKPGKIDNVYTGDDLIGTKKDTEGAKALVSKLKKVLKKYNPSAAPQQPADDIKLLSGKNDCTARTDSDVAETDDIALSKSWLSNDLYSEYACQSGSDGYGFSGWSSHSSGGSFYKEKGQAFGVKTAFADIKKLADANRRPLFVIYGKAKNKGSCAFNMGLNQCSRDAAVAQNFSACQMGVFNQSLQGGNFGFYFVYYFNDEDETCAEANEAKKFITQFGAISTGYPWYCAYCKYQDKHVYARYGSLHSLNVLMGNYNGRETATALYKSNTDLIQGIGREIQYIWTGGAGSAPKGDGVFANKKTGATGKFMTGQWYQFGTGGLQKFIDYAYALEMPVIAVGSAGLGEGARRCAKFEKDVLAAPETAAWLAEQDCLLLYCRSADGTWKSGDAKLFVDTFGGEKQDLPMVRVWYNGKLYMQETF